MTTADRFMLRAMFVMVSFVFFVMFTYFITGLFGDLP